MADGAGRRPGSGSTASSSYGGRSSACPPITRRAMDEEAFLAYAARLRGRGRAPGRGPVQRGGGLSLGLEAAGYRVVLSADRDSRRSRRTGIISAASRSDWDLGDPASSWRRSPSLISDAGVELLAGGPPCQPFSKAGRSKIRHRVRTGPRIPGTSARTCGAPSWRSSTTARPPAVVMENVPDMALDREMFILRTMVHELESLGYAVEERVVDTSRYGVPQFRQRLILVALRDGVAFRWPDETPDKVTVWNAIGDLPEVEGGWRPDGGASGWADYERPVTSVPAADARGHGRRRTPTKVFDHITRPVREDDKLAFQLMDADDAVLRPSRGHAPVPARHLRRQVQAAG